MTKKGGIRGRTSGLVSKIGTCGDGELTTEKAGAGRAQRGIFNLISEIWRREGPIELFFPGDSEVRGGPTVEGTEAVEKGPGLRRTGKIELVITDAEGQGLG